MKETEIIFKALIDDGKIELGTPESKALIEVLKRPLFTNEELEVLSTIVFEFCDSLDSRKDKDGNYKNKTWKDCLEFRDKYLHRITPKKESGE